MLTADDTTRLRESAQHSQYRRGVCVPVTFHDGPLDGMRITVMPGEAQACCLGFCVPTDQGPIQVLYLKTMGVAEWKFDGSHRVGWGD